MLAVHRLRGTWQRDVDAFIAVSEFLCEKLVDGGFARERIHVKTNFVEPDRGPRPGPGDPFLFLGRLSDQKGLGTLLASWEAANLNVRLRIVGEGPMEADARASATRVDSIDLIGPRPHQGVFAELQAARALVFPSRSYEAGFPMSILEAYACGLPVIASRLGNMAEIVQDGVTGLLFRPGDAPDLAATLQWALDHPVELERMGTSARRVYEARFTADANYEQLVAIYRHAILRRASRRVA
jgi:glycosyltransferase involved in cell wall biosynthesis